MLAVCDSMKIVEVPEEGRRRFIFRRAERRRSNSRMRKEREEGVKEKLGQKYSLATLDK